MNSKIVFRQQQLRQLAMMTDESRHQQEMAVLRTLIQLPQWQQASRIALTKSMPIEFSTMAIALLAWKSRKQVYVPVMKPQRQMLFVKWDEQTHFQKQLFGVEEPVEQYDTMPLAQMNLVIVPGLAFSKKGERLGFGGGYYDRALTDLEVSTLSVTYTECLFDRAMWNVEEFDVTVHAVITAEGVWEHE